MKRLVVSTCILFLLLTPALSIAQISAEGINYQAIARDTSDLPMANIYLDVRFTIYDDSSGVITSYPETHDSVKTNIYGLFTAIIGSVNSIQFSSIKWNRGTKSLKVEIAPAATGNFVTVSTNSLVSVPYALYSKNAGNTWRLDGNSGANNNFIGTTDLSDFKIRTNNTERVSILANGNMGIGTSVPNATLDIKGSGNNLNSYGLGVRNSQDIYTLAVRDDGYIGVGTTLPLARLDVKGIGDNLLSYGLGVSDSSGLYTMVVRDDGYVGVGTVLPNARLDVKGAGDNASTYALGIADSAGNYMLTVRDDKKVGIGTYTPLSLLSVGSSSGFQVNDSGTVLAATGITSSGTINFTALSSDGIVRTTGGTGTLSTSGGNINLTSEVTGILPVNNGGTGLNSIGNWQTFYSDGTGTLNQLPMGAAGTTLQSNGTSAAPSWAAPLSSVTQSLTSGAGISAFTYDGTSTATISIDSTGVSANTYSSALSGQTLTIPNFTVNEQGRLTSASTSAFTLSSSTPANFINGLTQIGDTAYWGGSLIQDTEIKTKEFNLKIKLDSTGHFTIKKNGNTTAFTVTPTNGNVGIGTNAPLGKLQIDYDTTVNFISGPGLNSYGSIHIVPDKNIAGNTMGITFGTPDEFLSNPRTTVQAGMYVQGAGAYGTKMYFATTDDFNTSGAKTRMMINHQGKVGIGTISPTYTLDVQAATSTFQVQSNTVGTIATIRATNDSGNAKLVVESATGGTSYFGSTPYSAVIGTDYFRSLHFATTSTVRATILPTGEFGIGTSSPVSKLDVEGGVSIGANYSGTTAAPADGAIIEGKVGIGTSSPGTSLEINGGITLSPTYVILAAGSPLKPGNSSYIRMNSATDISVGIVDSGEKIGQLLILENANPTGGGKIKIIDNNGVQLSSNSFNMNPLDTVTLIWNGTDWLETARSVN